jgi:hypothetical protein
MSGLFRKVSRRRKSGCVYIGYSYNHGVVGGLEVSPSAPAGEWRRQRGPTMSHEDPKDELERLRKENEALKKGKAPAIRMKVSEKGAVSVYGMGRFPVTLYREQWLKVLDMSAEIRAFIAENEGQLKKKD